MRFYDAHNHLHDERLGGRQAELLAACDEEGIARMVVNGSCEADWPDVLSLAQSHAQVLPSFGYHPWYVGQRSADWEANLRHYLDQLPAAIGEIGLDRWKAELAYEGQEDVFLAQLQLGTERNLPVSIHCLRAWGRLYDLLREHPRPKRGFLLHSYGGSAEMVAQFAALGGYFSLPGYFAHDRKQRQREAFKQVPWDRLLIETDAPDQLLPADRNSHPLYEAHTGRALNHPANLGAVCQFASELFEVPLETLCGRLEQNFQRLFGGF